MKDQKPSPGNYNNLLPFKTPPKVCHSPKGYNVDTSLRSEKKDVVLVLVACIFWLTLTFGASIAFIGWLKFVAYGSTSNYDYWYGWKDNLMEFYKPKTWENLRIFLDRLAHEEWTSGSPARIPKPQVYSMEGLLESKNYGVRARNSPAYAIRGLKETD